MQVRRPGGVRRRLTPDSLVAKVNLVLTGVFGSLIALAFYQYTYLNLRLSDGMADLARSAEVRWLAVESLVLRMRQDDVSKAMLINPSNMDFVQAKLTAYDQGQASLKRLDEMASSAEIHAVVEELARIDQEELAPADTQVLELLFGGDQKGAQDLYFRAYEPSRQTYDAKIRELVDLSTARSITAAARLQSDVQTSSLENSLVLILGVALVALVLRLATGNIARQLNATVLVLEQVADGNLTGQLTFTSRDEFGRMAAALNTALAALRSMVVDIQDVGGSLSAASGVLTAVSTELERSIGHTNTQASAMATDGQRVSLSVDDVATGVGELGAAITEIANNAGRARQVAKTAVVLSGEANVAIQKLSQRGSEIEDVVGVINDISAQVRVLSLNAAIEAARAGPAGRGFAVVASAVRAMAGKTEQATELIERRIAGMRSDTEGTTRAMHGIAGVIRQIEALQSDIAAAVEKQDITSQQITLTLSDAAVSTSRIAENIRVVARATDSIAHGAEQVREAATGMDELSVKLKEVIGRFRLAV